jgi:hypothetical protein
MRRWQNLVQWSRVNTRAFMLPRPSRDVMLEAILDAYGETPSIPSTVYVYSDRAIGRGIGRGFWR